MIILDGLAGYVRLRRVRLYRHVLPQPLRQILRQLGVHATLLANVPRQVTLGSHSDIDADISAHI